MENKLTFRKLKIEELGILTELFNYKNIDEMIEDFETMEKSCPRMFNLLRDISDR